MNKQLAMLCILLATVSPLTANPVGFDELFALDRDKALKQLIPGTPDYYYYHTLNHQHRGELAEAQQVIDQYIKRYKYSGYVHELINRQALLEYEKNPNQTLDRIKDRLNLRFNHQKIELNPQSSLPTQLDAKLISHETLKARALRSYSNLGGFEPSAYDFLYKDDLDPDRRRDFLSRISRPDYPGLAKMVVDDLNTKNSKDFGGHAIHRALLLDQLEECARLKPDLLNNTLFVDTLMRRLQPNPDVNWEYDPEIRQTYLDRLWDFVKDLPPVHNSLKVNVLYERLHLDRSQGVLDPDRFMTYIKLPRQAAYMLPQYLRLPEHRNHNAVFGRRHEATLLPPAPNDEPLVRDYLLHLLKDAENTAAFQPYIQSDYLKEVFAETKIVNGIGDMERWFSLMPPATYKVLKERIDLDFTPDNREQFQPGSKVSLTLAVKNIETLIVRTYTIHTGNYYRELMQEITTDIDLDGLVANSEKTVSYDQPAMRRHLETFDFPDIQKPGVYVIEFIGNGRSSRALVRIGRMETTVRSSAAGQVFTIYDGQNKPLPRATIWMGGRQYSPDEDGEITIPFSTKPSQEKMILSDGDFSVLRSFRHMGETYALDAGLYVDRESLLKHKEAELIVRPRLLLNGESIDLSLLEKPSLTLTSTDLEGTSTSKTFDTLKLEHGKEFSVTFRVPDQLRSLSVSVNGKVRNLGLAADQELSATANYSLNQIDTTIQVADLKLKKVQGQYVLECSGKTGEPIAGRAVSIFLKHKDFTQGVDTELQTSKQGLIHLGALEGITSIRAVAPDVETQTWALRGDRYSHESVRHILSGEKLFVPWMGQAAEVFDAASLIEYRGGVFAADHRDKMTLVPGYVKIEGLPAGDYSLLLKESGHHINLKVSDGERREGWLMGRDRLLEENKRFPMQLVHIEEAKDKTVKIHLANADKETRVHLIATHYLPEYDIFDQLQAHAGPAPAWMMPAPALAQYLSGRNIGDEYRYILERRFATRFPGNMLTRPSLILNPWSPRKTDTGNQEALEGEAYNKLAEARAQFGSYAGGRSPGQKGSTGNAGFSNFDSLPESALVLLNLVPDKDGVVSVDVSKLGVRQHLHVLAVNDSATAYRQLSLAPGKGQSRDLRLADGLAPANHFSQQKKISLLEKDKAFTLRDLSTDKVEIYDSLTRVHNLLSTLSGNDVLSQFAFLLSWPEFKAERKQELYKEYACHELNFFLFKKDPAFFKQVIKPYLANKKDKTFMDEWLLGMPLDNYTRPWAYARLNTVEQILLAQRIKSERDQVRRIIEDRFDLLPPDIEQFNVFFKSAIKGRSFDGAPGMNYFYDSVDPFGDKDGFSANSPFDMPAGKGGTPVEGFKPLSASRELTERNLSALKSEVSYAKQQVVDESLRLEKKRASAVEDRKSNRALYRQLDKTLEWVENNYYKIPIQEQLHDLVDVNGFWKDYAAYTGEGAFLSTHLAEAAGTFTEMIFALSVLDLPFTSPEHKMEYDQASMTITPAGLAIAYHQEIQETAKGDNTRPILISQNFFASNDRYRFEKNEQVDNFVTKEFQSGRVYGCQVILTNPTSSSRKTDVLLQIPKGAMPLLSGFYTRSLHLELEPYSTQALEYYFYFPLEGRFEHYPVQVSEGETLIASAEPFIFNVVKELSEKDTTSWQYVSQHGSNEEVMRYLTEHNLGRIDLNLIAFRMRDKAFFAHVLDLLQARHAYEDVLWSYSIFHNSPERIREYLPSTSFANQVGMAIASPLLTVNPVLTHRYEHKEYWPLVNPRTYQLGETRQILNEQFHQQYSEFLSVLRYHGTMSDDDKMTVICYLLLQDRVEEALSLFSSLTRKDVETALQYDYLDAYLAFYRADPAKAKAIAGKYADYPVDRWRKLFSQVLSQVDEINGATAAVQDQDNRDQAQTQLADTAPSIDFKVENRAIRLQARNLDEVQLSYYLMDIELLFSRNPFVKEVSGHFAVIQPNRSETVRLPKGNKPLTIDLPKEYRDSNVMIEVRGKGVVQSQAYYPNSLTISMIETYGQLQVMHADSSKPLSKTYVKVFARMKNGETRFFKDGYTDLRGRFDYTSLNTNDIEQVERFSILVMHDEFGSVIREAAPPKM